MESLFEKLEGGDLRCVCCNHYCVIKPGMLGKCRVRGNVNGEPKFPTWGRYTIAIDPIEKKPLYHFLPGSNIFSYGTIGCNFSCQFCQNSSLSMWGLDIEDICQIKESDMGRLTKLTPEIVVKTAKERNCLSVASTYNEPTVTTEFSASVFKLCKENGLYTVYVTNGYESVECLNYLAPYLDAVNIDLKSFSEEFYNKVCGGHLRYVLDTIRRCYAMGIHTEVTTLVIPRNNDSDEELTKAAEFIASVSTDIPWHLSAYHDDYKFQGYGHTPLETLQRAAKIGYKAGLKYIYIGNVRSEDGRFTKCPKCNNVLIKRDWFDAKTLLKNGKCRCGQKIPGFFKDADNRPPKINNVPKELTGFVSEKEVVPQKCVLYATEGNTSKKIAHQIASKNMVPILNVKDVDVRSFHDQTVVFVLSTYGKGDPPQNAREFWKEFQSLKEINIRFAVFGCGDSAYEDTFCGFAKKVEKFLLSKSCTKTLETGFRDDSESTHTHIDKWVNSVSFK